MELSRLPGIRRLASDYVHDFAAVSPFFSGNPGDAAAWRGAIAHTQAKPRAHAEIAALVAAQQQRRNAPAAARDAARRLGDASTVAVVTGQQAGLFGGPLYTLLKAITAIKLAAQISRDHQVIAVPVFWIDAEDHDWDEVRGCTVLDAELAPRTLALPPRAGGGPSRVGDVALDDSIEQVLEDLERRLPETEFRSGLIASLRAVYAPGVGAADAFGRWLEAVLGGRGLVVYDSSDAGGKALVRDVFVRELETPGETARLAALAGSQLTARGYHTQVQASPDSAALFHLNGGRRPIRVRDGGFAIDDRQYSAAELIEAARRQPDGFSPNVLLRPIVQDATFPTVAYVAGPNELAYLAQLRAVYEHFGVPMPIIYPRVSATVVDSAALRFLTRYNLAFESLQAQDEAALNELLSAQMPEAVEAAYADASRAVETAMTRLADAMPALDPTLEATARSTLGRMQHDLQTLHNKMVQTAKRRDDTLRRQFTRTRALTFPNGQPQERTVGFVSLMNQYGPALAERLEEELPIEPGPHWVLTI